MPDKIFLIDAYALIFRSYYAFIRNPIHNSEGFNTSILHGFLTTITDIIKKENPTYLVVVFDDDKPSFRKGLFDAYKSNRPKTPEDIKSSIPILKFFFKSLGITFLQMENYEADDVIGALAKKVASEGLETYMFTSDKDYYQLLSDHIYIYKPKSKTSGYDTIKKSDILDKFGIKSEQHFVDILALWGDSSDNIPGAKGIGEKSSLELVSQFGAIENIYENINNVPEKYRNKLIDSKEQVFLSKKLATIVTDIELSINLDSCKLSEVALKEALPLFKKYELRSVLARFQNLKLQVPIYDERSKNTGQLSIFDVEDTNTTIDSFQTLDKTKVIYHEIGTQAELNFLIERIEKKKQMAYSIVYFNAIDRFDAEILAVAISPDEKESFFIPLNKEKYQSDFSEKVLQLFENNKITKVGYDIKQDMFIFKHKQIKLVYPFSDVFLAHYLINPDDRHQIEFLCEKYLDYSPIKEEKYLNKHGKLQLDFQTEFSETFKDFVCERSDLIFRLSTIFHSKLKENKQEDLFYKIELPLVSVLSEMEYNGVALDLTSLKSIENELTGELKSIEQKIFELAGEEFNISSARQLGIILFDKLKINKQRVKLTKTKQYSTGEETLLKILNEHEIVPLVLSYRTHTKLLNTYVEALPELINKKTGKIHTTYNQAVANTGRLSSTNPNLQNIPIKDEQGRAIRGSFVPEMPSEWFVSADYSQIELRILAEYSQDPHLLEAFSVNMDIHTATAVKIYKVRPEEVTPLMRKKAKVANFGIIYGISAFGLSERLQIPRSESKELIDNYFNTFPTIKAYIDKTIDQAKQNGYAQTLFGRRKYLPDILSKNHVVRGFAERNAINMPIQGTAADIIKKAMIDIHKEFKAQHLKAKMILQVHDELCFDVPHTELGIVKQIIVEKMENVAKLSVPLRVDVGIGKNWLEAHQ